VGEAVVGLGLDSATVVDTDVASVVGVSESESVELGSRFVAIVLFVVAAEVD